jgi:hypothetical protein
MRKWIVLSYDGSALARASLRRATGSVGGSAGSPYAGIILAIAGVDPDALDETVIRAQAIAGADLPLEPRLLQAGDPIGSFRELVRTLPECVIAAPMGTRGSTGWYAQACTLSDLDRTRMLFFISPREIKGFEEEVDGRHRMGSPLGRVLRGCARLRLGVRAPVTGGTA